jgi:hypothetical protein
MKKMTSVLVTAVFGFGLIVPLFQATDALAKCKKGKRVRLECRAFGPGDTSMKARYKKKKSREKLSVSFEAAPGGSFVVGDRLDVEFNGTVLGSMILSQPDGIGDIEGDLDFDSKADSDDEDLPFPSIVVGDGDEITVGELGCRLED